MNVKEGAAISMKISWLHLVLAVGLLPVAGCGREDAARKDAAPVPLAFRAIESTDIGMPRPRPGDWEATILEPPVAGGTAYAYTVASDPGVVYGAVALEGQELAYGIGPFGDAPRAPDPELLSIKEITLVGKPVVRFKGVYGANAPVTVYVEIEDGSATELLRVATGHATEIDLDGDGAEEIVSEHGTPSSAHLYRWDGERYQVADLNEALGAESVRYVTETGRFEAGSVSAGKAREYRYAPEGLLPVSSK